VEAEGGKTPLQGVIAVTPALIQQMLTINGPVYIPEYHETVTATNLVDRIHYHQEGAGREGGEVPAPDGHSSLRKHFTELLAEHFLTSVRQSFTSNASKFLQLFINAIRSKDVQLYLDASEAEQVLQHAHLAADIQSPAGDSLFVVDANIAPNKANSLISNDMTERVTIDAQGNIMHRLLLTYTWSRRGEVYGSSLYRDYLRVYVPANSVLTSQQGWSPRGTQEAFGRKAWAGYFTLHYGQQVTVVLAWTVPASAIRDTQTQAFHYQYLIQRQAGTNWLLDLQVHLPSCAAVKQTQGDLNPPNPQHIAALSQPLDRDLNMSLDYTC
jgi:hypothetical protein